MGPNNNFALMLYEFNILKISACHCRPVYKVGTHQAITFVDVVVASQHLAFEISSVLHYRCLNPGR